MRKIYSYLLALTLMMVGGIARAQYTVDVTSDPENDYFSGEKIFAPAEIAEKLGLADAKALQELLDNGGAVYIKTADGRSNTYTGLTNQFWMNSEGVVQEYGDEGSCWYAGIVYQEAGVDEESGEPIEEGVDVHMGQMPKYFKYIYEASTLKATFYIVNGEKEVSFDITLNVNPAEKPTLADPVKELSKLTIVKDYELTLEFTEGKENEGTTFTTKLEGVYDLLGVTAADLDANAADYVFTQVVTATEENGETTYTLADELKTPEEGAGGAWYGRYANFDEGTAEEKALEINAPKAWGTGNNTFYTQDITLANEVYSIGHAGQFKGIMKVGDTDYTYHYLIVGDKAVRIKVQVNISEAEVIDPSLFKEVGSVTIQVSDEGKADYSTKPFAVPDMAAILTALGVEAKDITAENYYAWRSEENLTNEKNQADPGYGYWLGKDGYLLGWSEGAAYFIYTDDTMLPNGEFGIGQHGVNKYYAEITEDVVLTTKIAYLVGTNYYTINVEYTIKPNAKPDVEYKEVGHSTLSMQIIPSEDEYLWGTESLIDPEFIAGKIGTSDFKIYTDLYKAPEEEGGEGTMVWSSTKTLTDANIQGFWFRTDTYDVNGTQVVDNAGYGNNSFGFGYNTGGVVQWWQLPGARSVGDAYTANIYFANETTGEYYRYVLIVTYVDEVTPEAETVKTIEDVVALPEDGAIAIDTKELAELLGLEEAELEAATVGLAQNNYSYMTITDGDAFTVDADGYYEEDVTKAIANVGIDEWNITVDVFDPATFEKVVARIAVEYDGKRVIYAITAASAEYIADGISSVKADKAAQGATYNLSGQRVDGSYKGIVIRNGKKVLVK